MPSSEKSLHSTFFCLPYIYICVTMQIGLLLSQINAVVLYVHSTSSKLQVNQTMTTKNQLNTKQLIVKILMDNQYQNKCLKIDV
jgi:hypothetical protein